MDIVGKRAVFQHMHNTGDAWNGVTVEIVRCVEVGWYEVRAVAGGYGSTLALREELTIVEEAS